MQPLQFFQRINFKIIQNFRSDIKEPNYYPKKAEYNRQRILCAEKRYYENDIKKISN